MTSHLNPRIPSSADDIGRAHLKYAMLLEDLEKEELPNIVEWTIRDLGDYLIIGSCEICDEDATTCAAFGPNPIVYLCGMHYREYRRYCNKRELIRTDVANIKKCFPDWAKRPVNKIVKRMRDDYE